MESSHIIKGLYAITPDETDTEKLLHQIELIHSGGCRLLQYRNKKLALSALIDQAEQVKELCNRLNMTLIINDNVDICCNLDADGVHLGENDDTIETAREKLGADKIVGLSCYNSIERVKLAIEKKIDYVALGAFFPTQTKPNASQVSLEFLSQVKTMCPLPVVAIGGITINNASILIRHKVDAIAVINGLFGTQNMTDMTTNFTKLFV